LSQAGTVERIILGRIRQTTARNRNMIIHPTAMAVITEDCDHPGVLIQSTLCRTACEN